MEKMTKRQEQIVEKAINLIAEHGIQNVTIKNIAKEVGVSEPALYRHFKNKYEILDAVIDVFTLKIQPAIDILNNSENPISGIQNFIKIHFDIFNENSDIAGIIFSESNFKNENKLLEKVFDLMNKTRMALEKVIGEGQQNNQIRSDVSPSSISRIIIGSLRLLVTQWSISNKSFVLKEEGNRLYTDIIRMIK